MKTETKLFIRLGLFMLPLGIIYAVLSREEAGSLLLLVVAVSFLFIGVYLWMQARRMSGPRPEDTDATIADGAGEIGSFPVGSIFPFLGALALVLLSYGIVFNGFLAVPGVALALITVIGMARESYESETGHQDLDHQALPDASPLPDFSDQVKK